MFNVKRFFSKNLEKGDSLVNVVCVGNSHIVSFKRAFSCLLGSGGEIEPFFFPEQYLRHPWSNFDKNKGLSRISIKFNRVDSLKLPSVYRNKDNRGVLVLVGLGIGGNSLFQLFGKLSHANPAVLENGFGASPLMPLVYGEGVNMEALRRHSMKRCAPCYSKGLLESMFRLSIRSHLALVRELMEWKTYRQVFTVPAPNMPERVARWRLGEDYCDSGCQRVINDIYREVLDDEAKNLAMEGSLIQHNLDFENELGFIDDKYANSPALNDNHVNQEYYNFTVMKLFDRIGLQGLSA